MKLKDATAGQHVWLADGTECIAGRDYLSELRLVWRCNVNADDWFHLDTEVSTEPPPKAKPIPKPITVVLVWGDVQDVVVYSPAEIAPDGTITIRPAKTGGDK